MYNQDNAVDNYGNKNMQKTKERCFALLYLLYFVGSNVSVLLRRKFGGDLV
jgi:hypothetical protein